MTPKEVLALIREREVRAVDLRFMDFPGTWKHFTIPADRLEEKAFEEGLGFDGSSVHGWKAINESDMLVVPVADTAFIDPFPREPTLTLICNIQDPLTKEDFTRDPRNVARKAVQYMRATGIADVAYFGPEMQFYLFDDVRFDQTTNAGFYFVDSVEGSWNSGRDERPNLGYKIRSGEGYFPCPPMDATHDLRTEIMLTLEQCGVAVDRHHHEVATAGQAEVDLRYGELVRMADNVQKCKYIIQNTARKHGKTATFMPKPLFGEQGSGMQVNISLWRDGRNLFYGSQYSQLSDVGLYAIGGLLKHAPALCAITNPTTNSYKRLVAPGETPANLAYSPRNRSAAIRLPIPSSQPHTKRLEYRCPDALCNPYLAFAAILMAVLDGIKNKIHPGPPLDKDIYDLEPEELKNVPKAPRSLEQALQCLQRDHEFLLQGEVFTADVIDTWIWYKREKEVEALHARPHPFEFMMYFDA
jgi:glutamine synthetase